MEDIKKVEESKVTISVRVVHHKFAQVEMTVPTHIDKVQEWLVENEDQWEAKVDKVLDSSELMGGSGIDDYDGMNEDEAYAEYRYDAKNTNGESIGGHI
jgi:hypothetical protein